MHRVRGLDGRVLEPLRPAAVLWLLAPWAALFAFAADALHGWMSRSDLPAGPAAGLGDGAAALGLTATTLYYALALAFTWAWLAAAVPGSGPRLGLWAAAAALLAPWALALDDAPGQATFAALALAAAAVGVIYAIVAAALRARWSRAEAATPAA